jgi:hypothetical protein
MATWDDINMTPAQRAVAAEYEALGAQPVMTPDPPTASQTMQQATKVYNQVTDFMAMLDRAQRGARHVMKYHEDQLVKNFRETNQ